MFEMFKESFKKISNGISFFFNKKDEESGFLKIKGEIFWKLNDSKTGLLLDSGYMKNVVTLDASLLVAALMKGPLAPTPHVSEPNFGIIALAVGTGDIGWDPQLPPPGNKLQRSLYNEIARKQIQSATFIDESGNPVSRRTNIVDFTTIFTESEAVGPLTEMGLLGGDVNPNMSIRNPVLPPNGPYDSEKDISGLDTLVNYKTFKVINKPEGSNWTSTWRLTF